MRDAQSTFQTVLDEVPAHCVIVMNAVPDTYGECRRCDRRDSWPAPSGLGRRVPC